MPAGSIASTPASWPFSGVPLWSGGALRVELEDVAQGEDVTRHLVALTERGLVHPAQDLFRFHHVLVRDVAYRGIPKSERAELHELTARGLDRRDGADELVGYHFEQAYGYLTQLAKLDDHALRLANAGGERLGRAGIRAWKRADAPAAVNLLSRAVELVPGATSSPASSAPHYASVTTWTARGRFS